jgi:signal transduction histidine kinase
VAAEIAQRRSIANALHDGPVQDLASLSIRLGTYRTGLDDPAQQASVAQFESALRGAVAGIRSLMAELTPPEVDTDLTTAVRAYASEALEPDVELTVVATDLPPLPDEVRLGAYAIVQQGLSNVAAHAQAHHIKVTLEVQDGALIGQVVDDGVGAPPLVLLEPVAGHLGLRRMREYATALGGWVRVASGPTVGVAVRFRLPLEQSDA